MSHRLARGRDLLRERVESRLAGLTILLPTVLLADHLQPAAVPLFLARMTAHSATMLASGKWAMTGMISVSVRELVEATLLSLAPSKWKWLLAVSLLTLSLGCVTAASWPSITYFANRASGKAIQYQCGESP
jgi:hypothetical protein